MLIENTKIPFEQNTPLLIFCSFSLIKSKNTGILCLGSLSSESHTSEKPPSLQETEDIILRHMEFRGKHLILVGKD